MKHFLKNKIIFTLFLSFIILSFLGLKNCIKSIPLIDGSYCYFNSEGKLLGSMIIKQEEGKKNIEVTLSLIEPKVTFQGEGEVERNNSITFSVQGNLEDSSEIIKEHIGVVTLNDVNSVSKIEGSVTTKINGETQSQEEFLAIPGTDCNIEKILNINGMYNYLSESEKVLGNMEIKQLEEDKSIQVSLYFIEYNKILKGTGEVKPNNTVSFIVSGTLEDGSTVVKEHLGNIEIDSNTSKVTKIYGTVITEINGEVKGEEKFIALPGEAVINWGKTYNYTNTLGDKGVFFITSSTGNLIDVKLVLENLNLELRGKGTIDKENIQFTVKAGEPDYSNFSTLYMEHSGVAKKIDPLTGQVKELYGDVVKKKKKPNGEILEQKSGTYEGIINTTIEDCTSLICYKYDGVYSYGDMTGEAGTLTIKQPSNSLTFTASIYIPSLYMNFTGGGSINPNSPWEVKFTVKYDLWGLAYIEMAHVGIGQAGLDQVVDLITGEVTISSYMYGDPNPIESETVQFIAQRK